MNEINKIMDLITIILWAAGMIAVFYSLRLTALIWSIPMGFAAGAAFARLLDAGEYE